MCLVKTKKKIKWHFDEAECLTKYVKSIRPRNVRQCDGMTWDTSICEGWRIILQNNNNFIFPKPVRIRSLNDNIFNGIHPSQGPGT